MRSVLLALFTLLFVGGAFAAYLALQPSWSLSSKSVAPDRTGVLRSPATAPANQSIPVSRGERVYVETYDKNKGYLARRFRADTYDPRPDGTVDVTNPEA